ncbi:retinol dehydrogenase 16 isoform X1 [Cricetulus griseus]|uniref:retinol dehydrogenase 16 isoform X1 n=1 Tax=Cricetulus griseus TaxID=10029 RepID=UPI00022F548F|nr:retinol dehydrogenase 16 isoform X1 [Cricetulus griseus]
MWLYLVALVGLWTLLRWYRERQVVSHLQDKYVFITGCDSGFGNLLARQLDRRGMRVLAACLTEKGAEELRSKTSDRLETVILDVTKTESIVAATQWTKERVGNRGTKNSGYEAPMSIQWIKPLFPLLADICLLGLIEVTLNMLPSVRKARGRVVNVSSVMGRVSLFGGGYCISKYGVEAFSDSLRRELSYFGVKVAIIEPGGFKTAMTRSDTLPSSIKMLWDQASSEVREIYGEKSLASYLTHLKSLDQKCNEDLTLVTDCMEHALTSCHPRTRYSAGWDAKLFYLPLSYLPTFLTDAIFYWMSMKPAKAL